MFIAINRVQEWTSLVDLYLWMLHTTLWLTQYYNLDKYMLIYLEEGNQNMSDELHVARNWIT